MSQYQRLFLIADPRNPQSAALQRAAALARASGAALHVAVFIEPFATLFLLDKELRDTTRESYLQEQRQKLEEAATPLRGTGLHVTCEAVWSDDALAEILEHVAELQPDLLIKDAHHEPGLKRAFVTPLDWHLLRECPVPVHLVNAGGHALPRKVVAAVDPSRSDTRIIGLNERIIQAANGLALQCDADLHLLHTYDLLQVYSGDASGVGIAYADLGPELREAQEKAFRELAEGYGVPPERRHFIIGPPIMTIADFARESQADVLVMGMVQRKGLEKLIGSTTEHVLYQVPCSILAVRA